MFNSQKYISASKFSNCIQREQSKVILALPTKNSIRETFKKALTGGFSCVNTRLAFDTKILILILTETDYKKVNIMKALKHTKETI